MTGPGGAGVSTPRSPGGEMIPGAPWPLRCLESPSSHWSRKPAEGSGFHGTARGHVGVVAHFRPSRLGTPRRRPFLHLGDGDGCHHPALSRHLHVHLVGEDLTTFLPELGSSAGRYSPAWCPPDLFIIRARGTRSGLTPISSRCPGRPRARGPGAGGDGTFDRAFSGSSPCFPAERRPLLGCSCPSHLRAALPP